MNLLATLFVTIYSIAAGASLGLVLAALPIVTCHSYLYISYSPDSSLPQEVLFDSDVAFPYCDR